MVVNKGQFLSDEEKLEYYSCISGLNMKSWPYAFEVKMYEGAEALLYHYDKAGQLFFDTVVMCTDLTVTDKGIRVNLVDRKDFRVIKAGDIPNPLPGYNILTHTPYRCIIERTLKRTYNDKMMQGVTASLCFRSKSDPDKKMAGHTQAMPLNKAPYHFPKVPYEVAIARLEAGYNEPK